MPDFELLSKGYRRLDTTPLGQGGVVLNDNFTLLNALHESVDAHTADTAAHAATSSALASRIVRRDGSGGAAFAALTATSITNNISVQKLIVSKAGLAVGTRHQLNLIEGSNVTFTVADNPGSDRVDVTVNATGGTVATLDDLTDVVITSPSSGNVLQYTGATWVNRTLAAAGISAVGHVHVIADVTGLQASLDAKANLSGATFTGTVTTPTLTVTGTAEVDTALLLRAIGSTSTLNVLQIANSTLATNVFNVDNIGNVFVNGVLSTSGGIVATSITSDISVQKVEVAKSGTLIGSRKRINLVEGSNVTLLVADNAGSNRVDVTVTSSNPGGDITNASNVGVGGVGVFKQKNANVLEFKNVNAGSSKITVTDDTAHDEIDIDVNQSALDHGSIGGLGDDDHAQYALLAGRSGGQTLKGGTATSDNLTLLATSNGTNSGSVSINTALAVSTAAMTLTDAVNVVLGTSTGTKIGTATSQKLGFFNATPIVQPSSTTDLRQALIDLGLYASGGASPLNLNGGALTAKNLVVSTGTITSSLPVLSATQTWNNVSTAFTAVNVAVSNLASDSGSMLLNMSVGGNSKFSVSLAGEVRIGDQLVASSAIFALGDLYAAYIAAVDDLMFHVSANGGLESYWWDGVGPNHRVSTDGTGIGFLGATPVARQAQTTDLKQQLINFGFMQSSPSGATPLNLNGGTLTAGSISAGTVTYTTGQFGDGSVSSPSITFTSDTNTGFYRIGSDSLGLAAGGALWWAFGSDSTAYTPAASSLSSGSAIGLSIARTYTQSSTAAATDLLINRTQTSVGSGSQLLIDAQVGGTSRWSLSNTGLQTAAPTASDSVVMRFDLTGLGGLRQAKITFSNPNDSASGLMFTTNTGTQLLSLSSGASGAGQIAFGNVGFTVGTSLPQTAFTRTGFQKNTTGGVAFASLTFGDSSTTDLFQLDGIANTSTQLLFKAKTATVNSRNTYLINSDWSGSTTDASRMARVVHSVFDATAAREYLRAESDGTTPHVSLGGGAIDTTVALKVYGAALLANTNAASSGVALPGIQIATTYSQTSTAGSTDLLINRTQTSVGSGSQLFFDAQISGTSKFKIDNNGSVTLTGTMTLNGNAGLGGTITCDGLVNGGSRWLIESSQGIFCASTYPIKWTNGASVFNTPDVGLVRSSAGVLKVTDGSSGTGGLTAGASTWSGLMTINTSALTTNVVAFSCRGNNSGANIAEFKDGQFGSLRASIEQGGAVNCAYVQGTSGQWQLSDTALALGSAELINWSSTSVQSGTKDIGLKRSAAGLLKVTDGSTGGGALIVGKSDASSSGTALPGIQITPTYTQTSTAGSVDLLINRTETALGSGSHLFIDLKVSGSTKFLIDKFGAIITNSDSSTPLLFQSSLTSVSRFPLFFVPNLDDGQTVTMNWGRSLNDNESAEWHFFYDAAGGNSYLDFGLYGRPNMLSFQYLNGIVFNDVSTFGNTATFSSATTFNSLTTYNDAATFNQPVQFNAPIEPAGAPYGIKFTTVGITSIGFSNDAGFSIQGITAGQNFLTFDGTLGTATSGANWDIGGSLRVTELTITSAGGPITFASLGATILESQISGQIVLTASGDNGAKVEGNFAVTVDAMVDGNVGAGTGVTIYGSGHQLNWDANGSRIYEDVPGSNLTIHSFSGLVKISNDLTASTISATTGFSGNGSGLTNLTAANVTGSNDLPDGVLSTNVPLKNAANTFSAQNTFAAGTITTSQPTTFTQTWNNSGTTFTGLRLNVTNSASNAASLLMDLQVGGASKFKVDLTGIVTAKSFSTTNSMLVDEFFVARTTTGAKISFGSAGSGDFFTFSMGSGNVTNPTWINLASITNTATSGTFACVNIKPTYNQSFGSTSANTDFLINRTETALGTGAQLLADAQVGGVSKWNVDTKGVVFSATPASQVYAALNFGGF